MPPWISCAKKALPPPPTKAARKRSEGVIAQYIAPGGQLGVLVEINCQTDFVARNDMFNAFAMTSPRRLAADPKADFEADRVDMVAKIRENIQIPRHARMEVSGNGMVAAYIHTGAKVGVLVEVGAGKEATVANEEFKQLVKDITLQIAAGNPFAVSREQVPADVIAKENEIAANPTSERQAAAGDRENSSKACWTSFTRPIAWWIRAS